MRFTPFSALFIRALGLIHVEAEIVNIVRIDPKTDLVCLILPPPGMLIGDTEQDGHVQCTDSNPQLLPSDFFIWKKFQSNGNYVQAWGMMNDESVGLRSDDGGGQYDTHRDSGINEAPGYAVFVELLEPDSGRWCIRFCPKGNEHYCNMGKSTYGCEGALGIADWSSASPPAI